ncbi:MAG TPA: chromosomal replication initiator protein DnaA [Phycisphaerae bacterium]|nr:chromosomal replication initiator protein DnaA [Phycisphaerae bacterium]
MDGLMVSVRAEATSIRGFMTALQERIGPQKINAWFRHGTRVELHDGQVKVSVPNPFVANWIETHYLGDIAEAMKAQTGKTHGVAVTIDPSLSGDLRKTHLDKQAEMVSKVTEGRARPRHPVTPVTLRHRLEDFIVGASNKLAYSAAMAVVAGAPAAFNPLFLHGPCGVGKTHLLQGVCVAASHVHRDGAPLRCRYVTGEQFTNEFIQSIRNKKSGEFRARYRNLDLLVIDDVHFLAAKKATQDEFLHTFNTIDAAGKQIVMASDAHPRLVGELNEQLVSRFVAGMVVKIEPPDFSTRMEILRRKARTLKLTLPAEVLEYVAQHVRTSVRELEGALIKLAALGALDGGQITLPVAVDALAEHLARTDGAVTLGDIEAAVAALFGITPADLHSTRRTRTVSTARMTAMFLARRHTRMSYPEIGRFMGKNHSSVVLAVQRMELLLLNNAPVEWSTPVGPRSLPAQQLVDLLGEQFA